MRHPNRVTWTNTSESVYKRVSGRLPLALLFRHGLNWTRSLESLSFSLFIYINDKRPLIFTFFRNMKHVAQIHLRIYTPLQTALSLFMPMLLEGILIPLQSMNMDREKQRKNYKAKKGIRNGKMVLFHVRQLIFIRNLINFHFIECTRLLMLSKVQLWKSKWQQPWPLKTIQKKEMWFYSS